MSEQRLTFRKSDSSTQFRSQLEVLIARELDNHGVAWAYEMPVINTRCNPRYLPDFTIENAPDYLRLPRWVEGKPIEFLYALRSSTGIDRQYGERFQGEIVVDNMDHQVIQSMQIEELWKPKRLAEMTGQSVLVVGSVGGTSSLSIEMRPDDMVFSRVHPFVNWTGVLKEREREAQREIFRQRQAEFERQRQAAEADREAQRQRIINTLKRSGSTGPNRIAQECCACRRYVHALSGSLYLQRLVNGGSQWFVLCYGCANT